ncbi:hypothetical protein RF11_06404 [Thelohanellus kitauei]|uniref:Uncharacterized protein n=1 Tax=Thelohanellus kitauei TaxID=669202 RepID=A0A0C2IWJ7_THEKT|nr:hypothetical protein RF11_06404 [Thelohanellus kitauei]
MTNLVFNYLNKIYFYLKSQQTHFFKTRHSFYSNPPYIFQDTVVVIAAISMHWINFLSSGPLELYYQCTKLSKQKANYLSLCNMIRCLLINIEMQSAEPK